MTDVRNAPRGSESSLMFDGVAPVSAPTPKVDAAMLDAYAAPRPVAPVSSALFVAPAAPAFTMVGDAGEACGPDGCV
ncbi:hypothetical protein [Sanguibacter sp. HDW7]|uniref:hypothetical protein n=1 Tax=Sanguibacter sp. HDW7 TaxID=2714931 RepID=UPI00140CD3F3|nr:hypothetical protein [Sanguibacter sp. HDW7]QIK82344.1 hypothetical protein G7063_00985 [Sanguibacter sp. HDW7]